MVWFWQQHDRRMALKIVLKKRLYAVRHDSTGPILFGEWMRFVSTSGRLVEAWERPEEKKGLLIQLRVRK